MKRIISIVLIMIICAGLISACGGSDLPDLSGTYVPENMRGDFINASLTFESGGKVTFHQVHSYFGTVSKGSNRYTLKFTEAERGAIFSYAFDFIVILNDDGSLTVEDKRGVGGSTARFLKR